MTASNITLESIDIPQADDIWAVVAAAEGVRLGHTNPEALAAYLDDRSPRQGHYYMQAARILGLLRPDRRSGELQLSALGRLVLESDQARQRALLRQVVRECAPVRALCRALSASEEGLSREALAVWSATIAPLAPSTAGRRTQTMVAWLRALGLATWEDDRLVYQGPPLVGE